MAKPIKNRFIESFKYAFTGIFQFFKKEKNGQIELVCAIMTIGIAFLLKCTISEWLVILLCIAMVICAEMLNTVIEKIGDLIDTSFNKNIQYIKDVSAGAVLICSIIAAIIAALIFLPKIWNLIQPGLH
ncbi:MAG: diacylglycerol kinase family protein [Bacteroidetes bacterium]|mgnify:CR=1 FL=1|nr:diacylglycerol kinase family protein [Bacteroidota bacterium]